MFVPLVRGGDLFLGGGLRLQLRDVVPMGILAGSGTGIHVAFLDFEERLQPQPGEVGANLRVYLGPGQHILNLLPDFIE